MLKSRTSSEVSPLIKKHNFAEEKPKKWRKLGRRGVHGENHYKEIATELETRWGSEQGNLSQAKLSRGMPQTSRMGSEGGDTEGKLTIKPNRVSASAGGSMT